MLSRAGHGPGGKCATPSRWREPKMAVVLLWHQLRRLSRVGGPAAGCVLLPELKL